VLGYEEGCKLKEYSVESGNVNISYIMYLYAKKYNYDVYCA
jgi:hypothetical protein